MREVQVSPRTLSVKGNDTPGESHLRVSKDRVGWFTRGYQYLEFSLDGMEIGRYEGPVGGNVNDISGVAMSEAGDLVVSRAIRSVDGKAYATDFFQLDRGARAWVPVTLTGPGGWARAIGFDGRTLITSRFNG